MLICPDCGFGTAKVELREKSAGGILKPERGREFENLETDAKENGAAPLHALAHPAGWNANRREPLPQVLSPGSACFVRPFHANLVQPENVERTP